MTTPSQCHRQLLGRGKSPTPGAETEERGFPNTASQHPYLLHVLLMIHFIHSANSPKHFVPVLLLWVLGIWHEQKPQIPALMSLTFLGEEKSHRQLREIHRMLDGSMSYGEKETTEEGEGLHVVGCAV